MPLIQELANAPTSATPGFAYVPDTGYDPSKEAIIPTGSRKRQSGRAVATYGGENLSRQEQQKINRRLAELEKDNRTDVHIALPGKANNVALRGLRGKMTPAVKKIMQSQKTITNHLADEEAAIANSGSAMPPPPPPNRQPTRATSTASSILQVASSQQQEEAPSIFDPPSLPTQEEIETLLNAPALSYSASRVEPSASSLPTRQFCVICGYWGRARCKKCGERVCGLECLAGHQDNCQRY